MAVIPPPAVTADRYATEAGNADRYATEAESGDDRTEAQKFDEQSEYG